MPRMFDSGEARDFLQDRIVNLLQRYGTGVEEIDEKPGWKFSQPTTGTLLIENTEDESMPKLLVSVEVSR